MTTVRETLGPRFRVDLFVAGVNGERVEEAQVGTEPVQPIVLYTDDETGDWEADLTPNADIDPAGTVWARVAARGGAESTTYGDVPDSGLTLEWDDLVTDPPGTLPSSALAAHAAERGLGGHLPDAADDGQVPIWDEGTGEWVAGDQTGGGGDVTQAYVDAADGVLQDNIDAEATARANADNLLIPLTQKGAVSGVAELDGTGRVPSAQLPSFVDDVVEAANFAALPVTGEAGKIYVTLDDNKTYRWSGSGYAEISASLALGETSTTAYRGDRGKIAFDHSQLTADNPHAVTKADVGLSNADNTADVDKPVSTAQQAAIDAAVDAIPGIDSPDGSIVIGAEVDGAVPIEVADFLKRRVVRLTSDTTRTSTTTFSDTALSLAIDPDTLYEMVLRILYHADNVPDLKVRIGSAGGAILSGVDLYWYSDGPVTDDAKVTGGSTDRVSLLAGRIFAGGAGQQQINAGGTDTGTVLAFEAKGLVVVGSGTPSTALVIQAAQVVSDAVGSVIKAGSHLILHELYEG